jgi:hypothetical protein
MGTFLKPVAKGRSSSRNGRFSGSAKSLGLVNGGLDMPATHAECGSRQREHLLWTLTRRFWSTLPAAQVDVQLGHQARNGWGPE